MITKKKYYEVIDPPKTEWEEFYEQTQNIRKQKDIPAPPEWIKTYSKAYARMPATKLPQPSLLQNQPLKTALENRISTRHTEMVPLTLQQLSDVLYYSLGLKKMSAPNHLGNRFYPSAGSRFPIEGYIIATHVTNLSKGIYHYYPKLHILERVSSVQKKIMQEIFIHDFVTKAACIIVLTAFFKRSTVKYHNRGYNYTFIEAGHIGQNVSLISSALQIKSCPVGGFIEKKLNTALNLNPERESGIYVFTLNNA